VNEEAMTHWWVLRQKKKKNKAAAIRESDFVRQTDT
jgi:hypothetical protein